jgi:NAD-dependent deacetylase
MIVDGGADLDNLTAKIKQIADLIRGAEHAVVLTGAGVSTESGVPDFRSPESGFWTTVSVELFTIDGFKANPKAFYEAGLPLFRMIEAARPNQAHVTLARLEEAGLVKALITQNVDGLHQKAGSKKVLEIHGTLKRASCLFCRQGVGADEVIADIEEGLIPPLCIECGEPLKPDTVLFGEPLAPAYHQALQEAEKADLIMVIGSSMQVSPANQLPAMCDNLVIINRTPTFYDSQAKVVINDSIVRVMDLLNEVLDLPINE